MRLQLQGRGRRLNAGVTRRGFWSFFLKALLEAYFGEGEWGADSIIPTPPVSISVSVIGLPNPGFFLNTKIAQEKLSPWGTAETHTLLG